MLIGSNFLENSCQVFASNFALSIEPEALKAPGAAMNPQRVSEQSIFLEAIEKEESERGAFLDEACGDNHQIRAEVEALLAAHRKLPRSNNDDLASPPTLDEPITERPGTLINHYKLLEQIGEGGFGVVFMAEQTEPVKRKVALKILKPGMDTKQVVARFEAERQALAVMDHPHIARVYDGGATESGRPYFVMELVKGVPITQFCDHHKQQTCERLQLFLQVCQAVQHAHQKGIIHRDIKPSNVIVSSHDGTPVVKVIDFGIAKAMNGQLTDKTLFTGFAQMIGTPLYMSPEQAGMSDLDVDTRSDIYSLGVLLYELLTGTTPFDKERLKKASFDEIRKIIRSEDPPRPSHRIRTMGELATTVSAQRNAHPFQLVQSLRGDLDWIVMKSLEKDRTSRYETTLAFADDVRRYLDQDPVTARSPSTLYKLRKFVQRNKFPVILLTLVCVATLAVLSILTASNLRIRQALRQRNQAIKKLKEAEKERTRQFARSLISEAQLRRNTGRMGHHLESRKLLAKAAKLLLSLQPNEDTIRQLRSEVIACSALPVDLRLAKRFDKGKLLALSSDFSIYAHTDKSANIYLRRTKDDQRLGMIPAFGGKYYWRVLLSPNRKYLAVRVAGGGFRVWDWRNRRVVLKTPVAAHCGAFDFSPNNRHLAFGRQDNSLYVLDLTTGKERPQIALTEAPGPPNTLKFHPDGKKVAISFRNHRALHVYDVGTGRFIQRLSHSRSELSFSNEVPWSPEGKLFAADASDDVTIWDARSGELQRVLKRPEGESLTGSSFSPDGQMVASRCYGLLGRLFDPFLGKQLLVIGSGGPTRFRSDGRQLGFYTQKGGGIWDVVRSQIWHRIPLSVPGQDERLDVAFHPVGRLLACAGDFGVVLCDAYNPRQIALLPLRRCESVHFHPTDHSLITSGQLGVYRWPIRGTDNSHLRIGRPERLARLPAVDQVRSSLTRDGGFLAVLSGSKVVICDLKDRSHKVLAGDHPRAAYVSITPSGRWIATSTWRGKGVRIWDTKTGRILSEPLWPSTGHTNVKFSSDEKWLLASTTDEIRVWEVGSWQLLRRFQTPARSYSPFFDLSPDNNILAYHVKKGIQLVDLTTWKPLTTLEPPNRPRNLGFRFDAKGNGLAVANVAVHVWNLRQIRTDLQSLGLDWGHPVLSARQVPIDHQPLSIDGISEAIAFWHEEFYRGEVQRHPNNFGAAQRLAYIYANGPLALRTPKKGLPLAKKVVRHRPNDGLSLHTLALVYYRLGRYQDAVRTLKKCLRVHRGYEGLDYLVLAMCHYKLGQLKQAREYHKQSSTWLPQKDAEPYHFSLKQWRQLHAEFARLLNRKQ